MRRYSASIPAGFARFRSPNFTVSLAVALHDSVAITTDRIILLLRTMTPSLFSYCVRESPVFPGRTLTDHKTIQR